MTKSIFNLDIQARGIKDAVDQVFKLAAINVEKLIGRDNLDICEHESRVELGIGDAPITLPFVTPILCTIFLFWATIGWSDLLLEYIDCAACLVVIRMLVENKGPAFGSVIRRPAHPYAVPF